MFCTGCGNQIADDLNFCNVCGKPTGVNTPAYGGNNNQKPGERTFDFSKVNDIGKTEILPVGGHGMPEIEEPVKDNIYTPNFHKPSNQVMYSDGVPVYGVQPQAYPNGMVSVQNANTDNKKKSGAKVAVILSIVAVLLAAGAFAAIWFLALSPTARSNKELNLGQNYLDELEYKEAIASFKQAIKIDPKCEDAYIGMAEAYVALDDYESAIKILEKGYEVTESETIKERLDEVKEEYDEIVEEERRIEEAKAKQAEEEARLAAEAEARAAAEAEAEAERAAAEEAERLRQKAIDDYFNNISEGYEVGQMMPDFAMRDANGRTVYLSDYKGQVIFLNFFTTWCPYCYKELPGMAKLDCKVLMVDLNETPQEVQAYMQQYGYNFEVNYLSSWQCGSFKIEGVPTSFVIDEYGIIRAFQLGTASESWMNSAVNEARTAIYRELPELEQ